MNAKISGIKSDIKYIVGLFLIFLIFNISVAYIATLVVPYKGFFPYKEILPDFYLPQFISSFANFDGVHYILIAQSGYKQYEQALFPLYPTIIKFLSPFFGGNTLVAGLVISNTCLLIALYVYMKCFSELYHQKNFLTLVFFLLIFPTAFFFNAVYTESVFLLLAIGTIYAVYKKSYMLATLLGFLATLARLNGIFLFFPIIGVLLFQKQSLKKIQSLAVIAAPIIGLLSYSIYLYMTTGDPLMYVHAQKVFDANRSTHIILLPQVLYRYIKILATSQWGPQYIVSTVELVIFLFVFIIFCFEGFSLWKKKGQVESYPRVGILLFSFCNLILPTLTGTLSSIPRYALMCFSIYPFLSGIKNFWIKLFISFIFLILHIVLLSLFIQGYFVS